MTTISSVKDLRNWVDNATSGWDERRDSDVEAITKMIQHSNHPGWGQDWTEFLRRLDLATLAD